MALLFAVLINKRLEKERTNECIFVLTYLFNMCPGKRESFASKNFGNMPSEPPSVNLMLGTFESTTSNFHPTFLCLVCKITRSHPVTLACNIIF